MSIGSYLKFDISFERNHIFLLTVLTKSLGDVFPMRSQELSFCHDLACGGHFGPRKTAKKMLQSGFYWPTLFKEAFEFYKTCPRFQMVGRITK